MNKDQIIEAIESMSVLELAELVKALEENSAYPLLLRLPLPLLALLPLALLKKRPNSTLS